MLLEFETCGIKYHTNGTHLILFTMLLDALVFSDARVGANFQPYYAQAVNDTADHCDAVREVSAIYSMMRKSTNPKIYEQLENIKVEQAARRLRDIQQTHPRATSEALLGVKSSKTLPNKLTLNYVLNAEEFSTLQADYPGIALTTTNTATHPHAFAAASRLCQSLEYYNSYYVPIERGLFGEHALIAEFGANVLSHARSPKCGIHLCSPILDLRDSQREATHECEARHLISTGRLDPNVWLAYTGGGRYRQSTPYRCYKRAEQCTRTATYGMMLHSNFVKVCEFVCTVGPVACITRH